MFLKKRLVRILLTLLLPVASSAQDSSSIQFFIYESSSKNLSFKNISEPPTDKNFKPLKTNAIWLDAAQSPVWIRFRGQGTLQTQRYLELTCPNFGELFYYQPLNEIYKEYKTGFLYPFDNRPIQIDRFAFPVTKSKDWHYIKIKTDHFINTEFHVRDLEEIADGAAVRNLLYSIYMWLMIAVIAGVFFYIYLIKYFSYLFYVGYVFFVSSVCLVERGYYFQVLWPNNPGINAFFPLLPFGLSLCMLLFLRGIWINHKVVTVLYQITFWVLTVLPFLGALYLFFNDRYAETAIITQIHSLVAGILIIAISAISYVKAEKFLKLSLLLINMGLCILCISGIIFLATINHKLPMNFFTENAVIFGSAIEVCFLTAALVIRSDEIYKKQKIKFSQQRLSNISRSFT